MSQTLHMTLTASCDRHLVASEVSSQRMIEWKIMGPPLAHHHDRAPLNLALVLDRSGSMRGDKLHYVQQAACHVLDLLDERDRVTIVAYDNEITIVTRSVTVTPTQRQTLKDHINALRSGGQTNLSGGWLEGCGEVATYLDDKNVNRALLLTDGLANCGITDIEELETHARELRRRGIATSTFGVGLRFNEHLLEALAEQGGGHFYYIERPEQITEIFRQELGELLTVIARESVLEISVPRGISVEILGDLSHERTSNELRVFLGDLCASETRSLYTRVLTPPDAPGTSVVLNATLSFANLDGQATRVSTEIAFSYTHEAEALLAPLYQELLQRASTVEMAATTARALKLERQGQRHAAKELLQQTLAANAPYVAAPAVAAYQALSKSIDKGLNETERKRTHFASYKTRQSRS
ncbi:MAG: VWA domain-containing protein [Chloroflexota bacterium]